MVTSIRKFVALSTSEKFILFYALPFVLGYRLGLWTLPFSWLKDAPDDLSQVFIFKFLSPKSYSVEELTWGVKSIARYIPKATCLTQALAAQTLLQIFGYEARLWVGVMLEPERKLAAHAWITHHDEIVLGNLPNLEKFKPLLS